MSVAPQSNSNRGTGQAANGSISSIARQKAKGQRGKIWTVKNRWNYTHLAGINANYDFLPSFFTPTL